MKNKLSLLKKYIKKQAEDSSLWFDSCFLSENYLQLELRRLAWLIEEASVDEVANAVKKYEERYVTYH
jgi:hypothetical protein